jgi:flavin-dependent dehydrogenase
VQTQTCDVLVIGGGPAGSTISALLASRGRDVVILEKEKHPRFHIGESLLPLNVQLFEKLGVAEEIRKIGMPKYGAEFNAPGFDEAVMFDFSKAVDSTYPSAYQVRRSQFDEVLFRHAVRRGAKGIEECRVTAVEFHDGGVRISATLPGGGEGQWNARFLVDASGRDTFLANRLGGKARNPDHASSALYGHFTDAKRLPGKNEGNISMFWFDHGWFWFIPLADGTTSVGAVCFPYYMKTRKVSPEQFFFDTIALAPKLVERLRDAKLTAPVTATGNYSYQVNLKRVAGRNYVLIGDAFTFIDPVFSTGVMLAMQSGFTGADVVESCLDHPERARATLKAFDRAMRRGPGIFSWFIYRMNTPAVRHLFMNPRIPFVQAGVLSMLAGDVFRDTPLTLRLLSFKLLYLMNNLFNPRRWLAWVRKHRVIVNEA